jgi:hypothetical protein
MMAATDLQSDTQWFRVLRFPEVASPRNRKLHILPNNLPPSPRLTVLIAQNMNISQSLRYMGVEHPHLHGTGK